MRKWYWWRYPHRPHGTAKQRRLTRTKRIQQRLAWVQLARRREQDMTTVASAIGDGLLGHFPMREAAEAAIAEWLGGEPTDVVLNTSPLEVWRKT